MSIFKLINTDNYYFASCMKITKNKDDAYDLMMNTALKIEEKKYKLDYPKSLFYTIAIRDHINQPNSTYQIEDFNLIDTEYGKYNKDIIDCALQLIEQQPKTKREFVTLNIFKLYLKLKTEDRVAEVTRINRNTIHYQIQKFKRYALEHCSMYT